MNLITPIFRIVITLSLLTLISGQCRTFLDCFNCSALIYPRCEWSGGACKPRSGFLNTIYIFSPYEQCIDDNSKAIQDKYCGSINSFSGAEPIEISLPLVDDFYGTPRIMCKYSFHNTDEEKTVQVNIKTIRGLYSSISILLKATFPDDSFEYREILQFDDEVVIKKPRVVEIYYVGEDGFERAPFKISVETNSPGISVTIIITVCLIVIAFIICIISIYFFSKRIRARRAAHMNVMMMMNRHNPNPNTYQNQNANGNNNIQMGEVRVIPPQNQDELKRKKTDQLQGLFNDAMKPQYYRKDLGIYNLNCTICLEEFDKTSYVSLTVCRHLFHYDCLRSWLLKNLLESKCPNCNTHLLPELGDTVVYPNNNLGIQSIPVSSLNSNHNNANPIGGGVGYNSINANPIGGGVGYNSINANNIPHH